MKCIKCGKEAKWYSKCFVSPLCGECARKEVDKLLASGKYPEDESAVSDYYNRIIEIDKNKTNIALSQENNEVYFN